ncbi:hypothetical protein [Celeribacter sp.]|uniref:hypothetical protein n=1 Tax=Celeribacter sp. TaxID=1890673 RepID=UPI003A903CEA
MSKIKFTGAALLLAVPMALPFASPVAAENFTTAAEVRPILEVTKPQWIAVRNYEGKDLLYFTNLLAWRCGVSQIFYTVNGGAEAEFMPEPCYEDESTPNALKGDTLESLLVAFEPNSIETVDVRVIYDDGVEDSVHYERAAVQIQ